jgi:hypothetical protein
VLDSQVGGTGVVAVIKGELETDANGKAKIILFRADMDGLPIPEKMSGSGLPNEQKTAVEDSIVGDDEIRKNKRLKVEESPSIPNASSSKQVCCASCGLGFPFPSAASSKSKDSPQPENSRSWTKSCISENHGVSHACGHDGHVAMLVGAAKIIASRRSQIRGAVVLLFQPAEERHAINNPKGGAIRMIRDHTAGEELGRVLLSSSESPGSGKASQHSPSLQWTTDQLNLTDGFDTSMDSKLLEHVDQVAWC